MTRPPVEVRRAVVEDLDDLLMLWSQAREEPGRVGRSGSAVPLDQLRPRLREALSAPDIHVLLARWDGRSAGYAVLRVAPVLAGLDGPSLHVDHLFVLPDARRHGVARGLLAAATAIAERHGAEQVLAGAPPSARDTHRFLARLGFSPLVVRRAVGTAALRRRLAGEGQRRGLDDLLSRRRSLRARALRAGWPGGSGGSGRAAGGVDGSPSDPDSCRPDDGPGGSASPVTDRRPAEAPALGPVGEPGDPTAEPAHHQRREPQPVVGPAARPPAPVALAAVSAGDPPVDLDLDLDLDVAAGPGLVEPRVVVTGHRRRGSRA